MFLLCFSNNSQVDCLFVAESEDGPIAERYTSISVEASDLQEYPRLTETINSVKDLKSEPKGHNLFPKIQSSAKK